MRSSLGRLGLVITAVAVVASTSAAAADPQASSGDQQGTYVDGVFLGADVQGPLVLDSDGGEHVLAKVNGVDTYYTKLSGDTSFTGTPAPYPNGALFDLTTTVGGEGIIVVVSTCNGVKVFEVPETARSLPPMGTGQLAATYQCSQDRDESSVPASIDAVSGLDDGQVAVMVQQLSLNMLVGHPGKVFTSIPLPKLPPSVMAQAFCGDPAGDRFYAAFGTETTNDIVIDTLAKSGGVWRWTTSPPFHMGDVHLGGETYFDPTEMTNIASSHLELTVVFNPFSFEGVEGETIGAMHRTPNGVWSKVALLPGGVLNGNLVLLPSPHPSAAEFWEIDDDQKINQDDELISAGPVEERAYIEGKGWGSATTIPGSTTLYDAVIDSSNQPVVEYTNSSSQ